MNRWNWFYFHPNGNVVLQLCQCMLRTCNSIPQNTFYNIMLYEYMYTFVTVIMYYDDRDLQTFSNRGHVCLRDTRSVSLQYEQYAVVSYYIIIVKDRSRSSKCISLNNIITFRLKNVYARERYSVIYLFIYFVSFHTRVLPNTRIRAKHTCDVVSKQWRFEECKSPTHTVHSHKTT